jgi:hypothetical protein
MSRLKKKAKKLFIDETRDFIGGATSAPRDFIRDVIPENEHPVGYDTFTGLHRRDYHQYHKNKGKMRKKTPSTRSSRRYSPYPKNIGHTSGRKKKYNKNIKKANYELGDRVGSSIGTSKKTRTETQTTANSLNEGTLHKHVCIKVNANAGTNAILDRNNRTTNLVRLKGIKYRLQMWPNPSVMGGQNPILLRWAFIVNRDCTGAKTAASDISDTNFFKEPIESAPDEAGRDFSSTMSYQDYKYLRINPRLYHVLKQGSKLISFNSGSGATGPDVYDNQRNGLFEMNEYFKFNRQIQFLLDTDTEPRDHNVYFVMWYSCIDQVLSETTGTAMMKFSQQTTTYWDEPKGIYS